MNAKKIAKELQALKDAGDFKGYLKRQKELIGQEKAIKLDLKVKPGGMNVHHYGKRKHKPSPLSKFERNMMYKTSSKKYVHASDKLMATMHGASC